MDTQKQLIARSGGKCELCGADHANISYEVSPSDGTANTAVWLCSTCHDQIEDPDKIDANHWRCLNDSMWSTTPAVQVMAYRMLHMIKGETWPADLVEMMYLDDETLQWAKSGLVDIDQPKHIDSNGTILSNGDNVVIIQDLKVKGSSMVAKRGTSVRRIRLVHDNPEHIEGKVDGQHIVILTKYVKKSS